MAGGNGKQRKGKGKGKGNKKEPLKECKKPKK